MAKSLAQILGYVTLTGTIQATKSGIPNPLPDAFMRSTRKTTGDKARYTRVTGERRTSRRSAYGSPARLADLRDVGEVDVKLIHSYEMQTMDPLILKQLRAKDSYELDLGLDEVERQVREFKQKFMNLRVAATLSALRLNHIYFDANGNLLPTSSGNVTDVSFQVSANHQNQLNGIISASWALANTNIPLQLRLLKKQAARDTGYELKFAIYGENVPGYLTQNNYVQDFLARNPDFNSKYLNSSHGEIPDGLFGYTWIPAYTAFFEDSAGTNQDLWDDDAVVFTPEVNQDWWEVIEGSFEVPSTIDVVTDAEAAMRSTATVWGMFGYGAVTLNPPTVQGYYGDTFLPVIRNPDVIYSSTVAF